MLASSPLSTQCAMAFKLSNPQFPQLTLSSGSSGFPGLLALGGSPIAGCLISATDPQRGSQATDTDERMYTPDGNLVYNNHSFTSSLLLKS